MRKKTVKKRICEECGKEFTYESKRGRPPIYCDDECAKIAKDRKDFKRKHEEVYPDINRQELYNLKTKGNSNKAKTGKLTKTEKNLKRRIDNYKDGILSDDDFATW